MVRHIFVLLLVFFVAGCEDIDLRLATEAGMDALTAITLSDEKVHELSLKAAMHSDSMNKIAQAESDYAKRLHHIIRNYTKKDGYDFEYKVYVDPTINAFAMANGSIRIYTGLMDLMTDNELRFVIGHEIGHIVKRHVHKKMQLAYAGSALRKGIASQNNEMGTIAGSQIGGFAEQLINAQFSQQEEFEADDYGLEFLKNNGYTAVDAVSALNKLGRLGANYSFLSTHPDPGKRADRLEKNQDKPENHQLEKLKRVVLITKEYLSALYEKTEEYFSEKL